VGYTERWPKRNQAWPINPGDACTVAIDDQVLITGYVDDANVQFDARYHALDVVGRDAAGDLVDCSVDSAPGHWKNQTIAQIIADLCRPYKPSGLTVTAQTDVGAPLEKFGVQEGEAVFDAIERACRYRGVLPVSSGTGGIWLVKPGTERVPVALEEGKNILVGQKLSSMRDRFQNYTVKGSDAGTDDSIPEQNSGPSAGAEDKNVKRYRPLVVIAENPCDTAQLKKRAIWEAAVRRGRADRIVITVQGWTHPGGVWMFNKLVPVKSPGLKTDRELLIVAVNFSRDEQGTFTSLELCDPEGLTPLEIPEESDDSWI
jgi:prophage tail gpP-like protein